MFEWELHGSLIEKMNLFFFLGLHPWHMEFPRLGVTSELQLLTYTTATATLDSPWVCNLHHSSWQRWILNTLSKVRDQTSILMDISRVHLPMSHDGNSEKVNFESKPALVLLDVWVKGGKASCTKDLKWEQARNSRVIWLDSGLRWGEQGNQATMHVGFREYSKCTDFYWHN